MNETISPKALNEQTAADQPLRVIDIRDGDDYAAGHIPGAMHIPIKRLEYNPAFIPDDQPVVLYGNDHENLHEALKEETLRILNERGIQILVLEGGLNAWIEARYPIETE